jgi:hyperosmotically inducible periplasmic protein
MTRKGLVSLGLSFLLSATMAFACAAPTNEAVRASLAKDLAKYPGVTVKVDDCMATLSGTVDRYTDKMSAAHKARSYGALSSIVNNINVGGSTVPDDQLASKLTKSLAYDRTMMGNVFDWFTVSVNQGAVTIGGYAHNPMAHDSALGIVETTNGVKDVVDKVEVLPLSSFDDQIRMAAARRIYGGTSFLGSMDPAHPIRIIVDNGHVMLEGVVISQVDKQMAAVKVSAMPGVFSVENHLQVKKG